MSKGKGTLGHPRKKWEDQVMSDVENCRPEKNWWELAMNKIRVEIF